MGFKRLLLAAMLGPVLGAGFAALSRPAVAADLRPMTQLKDTVVRLSDLWDGVVNDRAIGPSPAPGARIEVEAPQLLAIARQFGVDWRPSSPGDRAVLERAGQPLSREEAIDALRTALSGLGVSADAQIELPGFVPPMLPASVKPKPTVSQLDYDAGSGRFTGLLTVSADTMLPAQTRVSGRVIDMIELPVPVRRMTPGTVMTAADLRMDRVRAILIRGEPIRLPEQAIGLALRHIVNPGQPLSPGDLGKPVLVQKGANVRIVLDSPGIQLGANGVAAEPGAIGERIRVLNPASRAVIEAEVIGPDQVRAAPGAAPVTPAATRLATR